MKFTTTALTILLTGVASISAAILRGNNASDNINYGRQLLPYDMGCVLYLKDVIFEDGHGEQSWSCEFTPEQAAMFGGITMMDIEGLTQEEIEANGAISGETIIRARTAFVEQFHDNDDSRIVLQIPPDSVFEVEPLEETDVRHARNRRARRQRHRNLADSTPGTLKVLVVRVIDSVGAKVNADALQLKDDIFDDAVCLKTQYAACSHDQLIIEQATEFKTNVNGVQVNGIVDVKIEAIASQTTSDTLENQALAQATFDYGGEGSLSATFDLVMFCQPPGSGSWLAYAYVNHWASYYNHKWCQSVSAQMHEVGHNFNLEHSGTKWSEYGDRSGMMGFSYNQDDGPNMCFNAAKSYQLGWYDEQILSIDPLNYISNPQTFVMNGVADYEQDGSNGDALVALRLENKGLERGVDYYIGYNRAVGANSGTLKNRNAVTLIEKENLRGRDSSGKSRRLAVMTAGESTTIQNYAGTTSDVFVMVDSINGKNATITISASALTPCVGSKLQIGLKISPYKSDIEWTIVDNETTNIVAESQYAYLGNTEHILPHETDSYCLQEDKCYTFTITDNYGIGLCCYFNINYYKGFLNGNTTPIFRGGKFGISDSKEFCVPSNVTPAPTEPPTKPPTSLPPTNNPTKSPSNAPTSPIATNQPTTTLGLCTNSNGTVKINKKKTTTCDELKNNGAKKKEKLCTMNAVFKACPGVCNIKCTCTDEKTFKLKGKKKEYKCRKVGKDGQPECNGTVNKNTLVEDVCPKKCDVCF